MSETKGDGSRRQANGPVVQVLVPRFYGSVPTAFGAQVTRTKEQMKDQGVDAVFLGIPWRVPPPDALGGDSRDDYSGVTPSAFRTHSVKFGGYLPELDIDVFEHVNIGDAGDTEISDDMTRTVGNVIDRVGEILDAGCWPLTMGGNAGPSSYAVLAAIAARSERVAVVNFDAHPDNEINDWRTEDPLVSRWGYSWARQILDINGVDPSLYFHVGLRGPRNDPGTKTRFIEAGVKPEHIFTYREIKQARRTGFSEWATQTARAACDEADRVWIALDADVFDLSSMPDFGFEPMGPTVGEVLEMVYEVGRHAGPDKFAGVSIMAIPPDAATALFVSAYLYLYALAGVVQHGLTPAAT